MTNVSEWIAEFNPEALLADGFEDAIIGVCERIGISTVVAYDKDRCIEILMEEFAQVEEFAQDINEDDDEDLYTTALEYFEFNVAGSYVGENTPVFITRLDSVIHLLWEE